MSGICLAALAERDRRLNEERAATATQTLAQQLAESPSALAVRQSQAARPGTRDDITCTYCLKPRHEEKDCYRKRDGKPRITRRSNANLVTEPAAATIGHMERLHASRAWRIAMAADRGSLQVTDDEEDGTCRRYE